MGSSDNVKHGLRCSTQPFQFSITSYKQTAVERVRMGPPQYEFFSATSHMRPPSSQSFSES